MNKKTPGGLIEEDKKWIPVSIVTPGNGKNPHTGVGTKIVNLETGQEISNIQMVDVHIEPNHAVTAEITMIPAAVQIKGAKGILKSPEMIERDAVIEFLRNRLSLFLKQNQIYDVIIRFCEMFPSKRAYRKRQESRQNKG